MAAPFAWRARTCHAARGDADATRREWRAGGGGGGGGPRLEIRLCTLDRGIWGLGSGVWDLGSGIW
eukprot:5907926-Prymnesium_polylepis.1